MTLTLNDKLIAKRYAQAFMRINESLLSQSDYQGFIKAHEFIKNKPHVLLVLEFSLLDSTQKETFVDLLQTKFSLPQSIRPLLLLLIKQNRVAYIVEVLHQIIHQYQKLHSIIPFVITTSHEILPEQKESIKAFLTKKTHALIECCWKIDSSIIGGIRAQSENLLWECSLSKQLRIIEKKLLLS